LPAVGDRRRADLPVPAQPDCGGLGFAQRRNRELPGLRRWGLDVCSIEAGFECDVALQMLGDVLGHLFELALRHGCNFAKFQQGQRAVAS